MFASERTYSMYTSDLSRRFMAWKALTILPESIAFEYPFMRAEQALVLSIKWITRLPRRTRGSVRKVWDYGPVQLELTDVSLLTRDELS